MVKSRTQRAGIDGQNNVIVQIEGDNNAVNLKGLAHLTLTRYLTRRHVDTDIDILSPYTRSIPLIGRDAELADLRAWLASEKPISIRVLTGRAGSGKTRLALELCEQMLAEGWAAGFLESGELERFRAATKPRNLGLAAADSDRQRLCRQSMPNVWAAGSRSLPATRVFQRGRFAYCCWSATPRRAVAGGRPRSAAAASARVPCSACSTRTSRFRSSRWARAANDA